MSTRLVALTCFFLSGATGLIYEVLWTRFLGSTIGNTHFSITVVVSVFMGGLGLGSVVGGRIADRSRNPLRLYGILILLIGLICLVIPLAAAAGKPLFAWLYGSREGDPEAPAILAVRLLFCAGLLLLPTSLMGATLPTLSRYFTRNLQKVGATVGGLYALNTLGAMLGALFTGFYGTRYLGLWGCNLLAVGLDIGIGIVVLVVARNETVRVPPKTQEKAEPAPATTSDVPLAPPASPRLPWVVRLAIIAFALNGFANMLLQIGWTKAIVLTIGNSTYAFSLIVTLFIFGIALGGGLVSLFVDRFQNLPLLLGTLILLEGIAVAVTVPLIGHYPILGARLFDAAGDPEYGKFLRIQVLLVSATLLPATTLMGTVFPVVGKIRTQTLNNIGRSIGTIYFWNTLGSILGTLAAGFVFIPLFGKVYYTLYLAVALSLITGLVLIWESIPRPAPARVAILGALAAVVVVPQLFFLPYGVLGSESHLWHPSILSRGAYVRLNFRHAYDDADGNPVSTQQYIDTTIANNQVQYYQEGIHAPVAVVTNPAGAVAMRISGKVEASLIPGGGYNNDLPHQVMAGHLPMILHPDPKDALTLGLGGGVTLATLTAHPARAIDSLEISPEVVHAARTYFSEANRGALDDPRVRNVIGDGRFHLEYTTRMYDVITSVPSNPWIAGIGNLFTVEFFEICKARLRDDGIICNWIHKVNMRVGDYRTVVRTFLQVFGEHAQLWDLGYDSLLIGSKSPIRIDIERLRRLFERPEIAQDLDGLGIRGPATLLRHFKFDTQAMHRFARPAGGAADGGSLGTESLRTGLINTDTHPVLEFSCPFGLYGYTLDAYKGLADASYTKLTEEFLLHGTPEDLRQAGLLQTAFQKYLESFIREMEVSETVSQLREQQQPLTGRRDLLEAAQRLIGDLKEIAVDLEAAGGDPWLGRRAAALAERALDVPTRESLAGTLGSWFLKVARLQKTPEESLKYAQQARPFAHADAMLALDFADLSLKLGRANEGLTVLRKALEGSPKNARLYLATGVLLRTLGASDKALEAFDTGLRHVTNPIVRSQLHADVGLTYQNKRQFDFAMAEYEKALEIHPENEKAQQWLENLHKHLSEGR